MFELANSTFLVVAMFTIGNTPPGMPAGGGGHKKDTLESFEIATPALVSGYEVHQ